MTIKKKLMTVGAGAMLVAGLVVAPASGASATTPHGPYWGLSDCRQAMVTMDNKGYTITMGCYYSWGTGGWHFHTA